MQQYEYAQIPVRWVPADIMKKHNLQEKIHNGNVYVEIRKGMYGLKQAARLAYDRLDKCSFQNQSRFVET